MTCIFICVIAFIYFCQLSDGQSTSRRGYYGIPVPGGTVTPIDVLRLYADSCRTTGNNRRQHGDLIEQARQVLSASNSQQMAADMHSSIYFALGDVQINMLMGRWYTVVDSPNVHSDSCAVYYFDIIEQTEYTATFGVRQYTGAADDVKIIHGFGLKIGPEAGQLLIHTAHPGDICPYSIVQVGPVDNNGQYAYVILSQMFKRPTMVLARDIIEYSIKYADQVANFLNKYNFANAANSLHFVNTTHCYATAKQFYFDI